jgi:hypothetical protein
MRAEQRERRPIAHRDHLTMPPRRSRSRRDELRAGCGFGSGALRLRT